MNNKQNTTADHSTHQEDGFTLAYQEALKAIKALEKSLVEMELNEIAAKCRNKEKKVKEIKKIKESMN